MGVALPLAEIMKQLTLTSIETVEPSRTSTWHAKISAIAASSCRGPKRHQEKSKPRCLVYAGDDGISGMSVNHVPMMNYDVIEKIQSRIYIAVYSPPAAQVIGKAILLLRHRHYHLINSLYKEISVCLCPVFFFAW